MQAAMEPFYGPMFETFMGVLNSLTVDELTFMRDLYARQRGTYEAHIEEIRKKYGDK